MKILEDSTNLVKTAFDKAIKAAYEENLDPMNELLEVLKNPFEENKKYSHLTVPPKEEEKILQTFCGT